MLMTTVWTLGVLLTLRTLSALYFDLMKLIDFHHVNTELFYLYKFIVAL